MSFGSAWNKRRYAGRPGPRNDGQAFLPIPDPQRPPESDIDSRYTLRETLDWCKRVAKVDAFDLDAAACAEAHVAERYFTAEDDGLKQPWTGRVWCNPPYSDIGPWVEKAWTEIESGRCLLVAMLLPATRTEQAWWQQLVEPYRDVPPVDGIALSTHFLPGRQRFGIPGNPLGIGVGSPPFGCVLLLFHDT